MLVGDELGGANGLFGVWFVGGREKFLSALAGTDAVTPVGVAILLEGRRVHLLPHSPPSTSLVVVASLLEIVALYAA